ncbi:MAG: SDR family oxidoreductase [Oscillospiraceae bacterium]|jgi:NAD(P)-dependent dehydrogenase (short-subunit alcohol dehydrogenase family)
MIISLEKNLDGKVAVITGGGGILCGSMAKALGEYGVKVAVLDLNEQAAQKVADEITAAGGQAIGVKCNVLEAESVRQAHQKVKEAFGPIDILINGAGGNHPKGTTDSEFFSPSDLDKEGFKSFYNLDADSIRFVFDLNFMGTLLPTQEFSRDLIEKGGSILNISSMNAFTPLTKIPAYSAAKAAISNFTQWLAVHFSKTNIRVNAIAPGFFLTDQNRALLTNEDGSYTARSEKILRNTPMGRFGVAEELLGTMLFLLDENMSGFITGVVIPVDGGFSAYSGV